MIELAGLRHLHVIALRVILSTSFSLQRASFAALRFSTSAAADVVGRLKLSARLTTTVASSAAPANETSKLIETSIPGIPVEDCSLLSYPTRTTHR